MNDKKVPVTSYLMKNFAIANIKAELFGCKRYFYQPKVPQKVLDKFKK